MIFSTAVIRSNSILQAQKFKYLVNSKRLYQSEHVFGYKKKKEKNFTIPETLLKNRIKESNLYRLVTAYREHGHKKAKVNPISISKDLLDIPELKLDRYGLNPDEIVDLQGIFGNENSNSTIEKLVDSLENTYCAHISAEFAFLENEEEREWFSNEFENLNKITLDNQIKMDILREMLKAQEFDRFLAAKYPGLKRYGGEGAEGMIPFYMELFRLSALGGIKEIVAAFSHRGRLNVLTGLLDYPPSQIFLRLKGEKDFPETYEATGDVLSHINVSVDLPFGDGKNVHVTVLKNPSHLEAVNPVSMGKTRAKQLFHKEGGYGGNEAFGEKILNIQVHGDAALIGQGVNQETLNMYQVPHFEVGGSIHMVTNNQLGFTTPPERGRSTRYCTDLAKMISAPIIHVNGDYPELVLKATKLVFEYQRKFRKDVFLDINCYRQWGHNELDDPTFTNPSLYKIIQSRKTVPDSYADKLIEEGILTLEKKNEISKTHSEWLNDCYKNCDSFKPPDPVYKKNWENFTQAKNEITKWNTGVNLDLLTFVGRKSVEFPNNFKIHPTLQKTYVKNRLLKVNEGSNIDWATAETLAFGSLLYEGYNVRISGQDVGRGTFSHRHAMLVDQETNEIYIPLNNIHEKQTGFLEVANSILSEEAVLGFEYGFSLESPMNLCVWEAQFGDFFNSAQIPFDTFVVSGETKWLTSTGLTILLPHGYDGAGPDHSSSRIERILLQTDSKEDKIDGDNVNLQVCQPSTPAQYFHLLRRQMVRNFRKPLVIISPKTLLRLSEATSNFSEMGPNSTFHPVIGDDYCDPNSVKKVLITSGKHFYTLSNKRQQMKIKDTAIIRLESFSPFPTAELLQEIEKFKHAKDFIWCQEEPRNMGAWSFIKLRFENLVGRKISYCGREVLAASSVGVAKLHQKEVAEIETKPFLV